MTLLALPNRHLEYAMTWYGLAATLLAVVAFVTLEAAANTPRARAVDKLLFSGIGVELCANWLRFARLAFPEDRTTKNVNYISDPGRGAEARFEDVLLAGLARDGGLYVPESVAGAATADDRCTSRVSRSPSAPQ